jgi:hypothetical protein
MSLRLIGKMPYRPGVNTLVVPVDVETGDVLAITESEVGFYRNDDEPEPEPEVDARAALAVVAWWLLWHENPTVEQLRHQLERGGIKDPATLVDLAST